MHYHDWDLTLIEVSDGGQKQGHDVYTACKYCGMPVGLKLVEKSCPTLNVV